MLNIYLDDESEKYLLDLISEEQTSGDIVIKRLLKEYWSSRQQSQQTVLERLGGYPRNVITETDDLSDRDVHKSKISAKLEHRYGSV